MDYKIELGPVFTVLRVGMKSGETFKAEAGAMISMSTGIELKAKATGKGLLGTLGAALGGESMFGTLFTATADGEVVLAPPTPGDIVQIKMTGGTVLAQAGAYLAGSDTLELSTQGSFKAMVSGEGLFLSKITGSGDLFLATYGGVMQKTLAAGETYVVDCGHIVAFDSTVNYKIRKAAKGIFSTLVSGEGLVGEYVGPGRIWAQTRNLRALASSLVQYLPKQN